MYHDPNVQRVICNAVRWAAPANGILPGRVTRQRDSLEPITTRDPMAQLDTSELHKAL